MKFSQVNAGYLPDASSTLQVWQIQDTEKILPVAGETILQGWERRAASALVIFVGDVAQVEVNVPASYSHRYIPQCLTC